MTEQSALACGLIIPLSFQSCSPCPASGRLRSHLWNFGEDLENKKADKIRKGVVGTTGRKAPIIPNEKANQAEMKQKSFTATSRDP